MPGIRVVVPAETSIGERESGGSLLESGSRLSMGVWEGGNHRISLVMKAITGVLAIASAFASCSRQTAPSQAPAVSHAPVEGITIPPDLTGVEITLERTECFGTCPSYVVAVDGNGRVTYTGRAYVRETGKREGSITQDKVRVLAQRFIKAGFFAMQDAYRQAVSDCETTYLTVKVGTRTKRVTNYWAHGDFEFPPEQFEQWQAHVTLDMLAESVDRAVQSGQWTGDSEFDSESKMHAVTPFRIGSSK